MSNNTNSSSMAASMMSMTFFSSDITPLFSAAWTPSTPGAYAATCIFLIAFSAIYRGLVVLKAVFDRSCIRADGQRAVRLMRLEPINAASHEKLHDDARTSNRDHEFTERDGLAEEEEIVENDVVDSHARRGRRNRGRCLWIRRWRIDEDIPRTILVTVTSGVSYLLMLAVMTLNVGYFLSVMAGIAIGELLLGRAMLAPGPG